MLVEVRISVRHLTIISIYGYSICHLSYARCISLMRLSSFLVGLDHASEHVGLGSEAFVLILFPLRLGLVVLLIVTTKPIVRHLLISCTLSNFGLSSL